MTTTTPVHPGPAPSLVRVTWNLSRTEVLLFLRETTAVFFTMVFPILLLVFVGVVYGDEVDDNGVRFIDLYYPSLLTAVAANIGVMGLSISLAQYRSTGVLRRYRLAPFPFSAFMASQIAVGVTMYLISCAGMTALVAGLYGIDVQGSLPLFAGVLALGLALMLSLGFLIGGLNLSVRTAQLIGTVAFFFMFFGSGAAIPRQQFPHWLQLVTEVNPLTHLSDSLVQVYLGRSLDGYWPGLIGLAVGVVVVVAVVRRTFTWEVAP